MKRILSLVLSCILLQISLTGFTQLRKKPIPADGYWVIENNIKTPKHSVVYFYNKNQELIHKETVAGRKLNVSRNKIVKQLNGMLHEALTVWQNGQILNEGNQLVKNKL